MSKGKLIIMSGPSGVGKGTIVRRLLLECDKLSLSVSATTREPRKEDKEGVTYFFKTVDEFKSMIENNDFLEWAIYNGNYYGTPIAPLEEKLDDGFDVILEIDVQGALNVMKNYKDAVYIFIAPPNEDELYKRLENRGSETREEIERRVNAAKAELLKKDEYDYVVINDILDKAVESVKNIIEGKDVL